jgi:hypothetical protein
VNILLPLLLFSVKYNLNNLCNHRRHGLSLKSNNNSNLDPIETRLNALGLKLPKPLKIASNIQISYTLVRVRGNKATFQAMAHRILMARRQDHLER